MEPTALFTKDNEKIAKYTVTITTIYHQEDIYITQLTSDKGL